MFLSRVYHTTVTLAVMCIVMLGLTYTLPYNAINMHIVINIYILIVTFALFVASERLDITHSNYLFTLILISICVNNLI